MKILHVTLGNPNDHQGGLNRYCLELMRYQQEQGHEVALLYPSSMGDYIKNVTIKKDNNSFWRICGALPTAITYGIDDPKRYIKKTDSRVYHRWLQQVKPDVVHVHSIQGIHLEFFQKLSELNIPSVYTTHDYYPMCVRALFLNSLGCICEGPESEKCARCNYGAGLSPMVQMVRQSYMYRNVKNLIRHTKSFSGYVKNRGNAVYSTAGDECVEKPIEVSNDTIRSFAELIAYNRQVMSMMGLLHCNSPATQSIYAKYYPEINSRCIPVVHEGLARTTHKQIGTIKFSYFGGTGIPKGYEVFQNAISFLKKSTTENWEVFFYGGEFNEKYSDSRIHFQGYFSADEENVVWGNTDVLIVPSICYETYGFGVVEGLCHGIPVIVSDTVGSGYLLNEIDEKLVFHSGNSEQLFIAMKYVMEKEHYKAITSKISAAKLPVSLSAHAEQMQKVYSEIVGENV